jgi:O-acetyl-ADP-ribose deacetylase (regulator of RNase III)
MVFSDMKIEVMLGNLVSQPDLMAIVNSANANLRLGSGVAGAVHTGAGPELEEYCKPFAPLELGKTLLTPAFKLPNQWVIHVRAAHYLHNSEPEHFLEMGLISVFQLAEENQIESIGIPAIGTGMFKFPPMLAARINARVTQQALARTKCIKLVRFCVASKEMMQLYASALALDEAEDQKK